MGLIPQKLHAIWVGDDAKRPRDTIESWQLKHPTWQFRLWGNAELDAINWKSKRQIDIYRRDGMWEGVADLMRYEILHEHGGVYVDADTTCIRSLDDWLLEPSMFVVWENEELAPGLIANTFIGSQPGHPALALIVRATSCMARPVWRRTWRLTGWNGARPKFEYEKSYPWVTVGPKFFTKMVMPFCPNHVTILPSVLFLPQHHTQKAERKSSLVYATHAWGTTHQTYSAEG